MDVETTPSGTPSPQVQQTVEEDHELDHRHLE
jgi:hypothetical protein